MKNNTEFLHRDMLKLFIILYLLHPSVYFLSLLFLLGLEKLMGILGIILVLAPPIIILFTLIFFYFNRKLKIYIAGDDSDAETFENFLAKFPIYAMLLLVAGCTGGPVLTAVIGSYQGVIVSAAQGIYFFLVGFIQALVAGALFYYFSKIRLFALVERIRFSPLTIFYKFLIPILSLVIIIILGFSALAYRISYNRTYESYETKIRSLVTQNVMAIDSLYGSALAELNALSISDAIQSMERRRMMQLLLKAHNTKGSNIEMLFAADRTGNSPNSFGTVKNIGDRWYFRKVLKTGKPVFSDPVINKKTGKQIVVCAVPVRRGKRIVGITGATLLIDTIKEVLMKAAFSDSGRFMIVNKGGKFLFHPEKEIIGKIIGKDIVDDGDGIVGIERIVTQPEKSVFFYTFQGRKVMALKHNIPVAGFSLVYSVDQIDFVAILNGIIYQMIVIIIFLACILSFLLYLITRRFSVPIKNTIDIIQKLTEGDLTQDKEDILPDEFGMLLMNFSRFRKKLRDVIDQALEAAIQLSSSSEELAATSQTLSMNSQAQAASVEEATASIEEVSGSIENINTNATNQSQLASVTFTSMNELKKNNETVIGYAGEALKTAKNTTEQARTGNELMQNTISGMNNIDASTHKIAERVRLISDISDQVNLLALNASIEAARAGEHGKGFAVVAEEISKLADETAASAKSIADLVHSGLVEVNQGREFVDSTGNALNAIISNIEETELLVKKITESFELQDQASQKVLQDTRRVMDMAESISVATNEQMQTNQEMAKTIEQINQNTQSEAAGAEEIASSAEEISSQAESLRSQMEFFKVS